MYTFHQRSGRLYAGAQLLATGYAGQGAGKNNPDRQDIRNEGPLPRGIYAISAAFAHPQKGPLCMRLTPAGTNEMFGRAGFLIHGDSIAHPGTASQGCLILPCPARRAIAESPDRILEVVA